MSTLSTGIAASWGWLPDDPRRPSRIKKDKAKAEKAKRKRMKKRGR